MLSWTPDTVIFTALTFSAAAWGLLHLGLSLRAARAARLPMWLRVLAWLPPLTPVAGFWCGAPVRTLAWLIVAGAYLVLRTYV